MPLADAAGYPLWLNVLVFAVAAVFVWRAGTRLTGHLAAIADRTGLGQAFAGMLLLGTITSLPEVANVLASSIGGDPALAVNNLLGSASMNLVLLALADAAIGREAVTGAVARPAGLMQAALCMLVLALVAMAVTSGDIAVYGIGLWALGLFIASIGAFWLSARYGARAPWQLQEDARRAAEPAGQRADPQAGERDAGFGPLIGKAAIGAAVIFVAGYVLSQTGDALAQQTGLGAGLVGFLLIGFATSMPELSTIVAALRMRRHAMAIGEILGTNFVNLSLILLADVAYTGGPVLDQLGSFEVVASLLGVLLTGVYLVGLLEHRDRVVLRMGYDSAAVLVLFAAGVGLLFAVR